MIRIDVNLFRICLSRVYVQGLHTRVRVSDIFHDGHGHVRHSVAGASELGSDSHLQVRPSLAVSPCYADPVLVHPELRNPPFSNRSACHPEFHLAEALRTDYDSAFTDRPDTCSQKYISKSHEFA